ncbi:MAG: nucleotidyl transferase AbiEii/AbiGii toxin family protein [Bacteroidales bacterium]|nr:nucleotidyl transferase AbiEii/AbiGii toxin family protein [Bacteroidales bacterium]
MQKDYFQNTLYPLQDKVLSVISGLPVDFYLTGGTVLSRVYLHHRYSDDLDFFVNDSKEFKIQMNHILEGFKNAALNFSVITLDEGFARLQVNEGIATLKLDFVNDVTFRCGSLVSTDLFLRTDNIENILSNKISALGRSAAKDLIDIIYICGIHAFYWEKIMADAQQKDIWANEVELARMMEQFPISKIDEISWIGSPPASAWISERLAIIIGDIITGKTNSLKE